MFLEITDDSLKATELRKRPFDLVAYGVFAVSLTIFRLWIARYAVETELRLMPFIGSGIGFTYPMTLFFVALALICTRVRESFRLGIISMLLLQIVLEARLFFTSPWQPDFGNPYLRVSPWRVVWIVLVPALWAIVLFIAAIPTIRRWIHELQRRIAQCMVRRSAEPSDD